MLIERQTIRWYDHGVLCEALRFSFNGQEKVDEISGAGNHNTALFWEYDTRLGRRWNVDPVVKPYESSYATFSDNPIYLIDPNGDNAGEYYKDGVWVASDGINDGKVYHADENGDFEFGTGVIAKPTKFKEWTYKVKDEKLVEFMDELYESEGGYNDRKADSGGKTNYGIAWPTWLTYAKDVLGVEPSVINLKQMQRSQAEKITELKFWDPSQATRINDKQFAFQYFDTYFNGGGAIVLNNMFQHYGYVKQNTTTKRINHLNTILKVYSAEELFNRYRTERLLNYEAIIKRRPKDVENRNGWIKRANSFKYRK
jgi:Glycosyl hydrolase 108